ncbi:MAG TPA: hypothetical protein VFV19_02970 [Candidatus Polarisedimenticolaceae bacterium]|nr:hypothetical protein [Candidatus Polarisedimenticolaceae bacterium]
MLPATLAGSRNLPPANGGAVVKFPARAAEVEIGDALYVLARRMERSDFAYQIERAQRVGTPEAVIEQVRRAKGSVGSKAFMLARYNDAVAARG